MSGVQMHLHIVSQETDLIRRLTGLANEYGAAQRAQVEVTFSDDLLTRVDKAIHLLIIDLETLGDAVLQQLPRLQSGGHRPWVVVTYREPSSERLIAAMRSGVNDYLNYHPDVETVRALFRRAEGSVSARGSTTRGQLISVFSNKGGVGTTMMAINIAAALQEQIHGEVAVVDLVLQHGDISVFLDLPSNYTVVNLISDLDRADLRYLKSALPKHGSGIHVLPAPYVPDEAELINAHQIGRLLEILRGAFSAVVVDLGNEFNELTLTALDASDRTLLVTLPTLPSIRNTRRSLDLFNRLGYDPSRLILVANRHDAKEKVDGAAMEEALGRPIDWSIPNDYINVTRAINQGTSLQTIQPKSRIAESFRRLVTTHLMRASDKMQQEQGKPRMSLKSMFRR